MLSPHQKAFVELLVTREALRFGDFTLKSGRKAPFFINTGCFHQASDIAELGAAYAAAIVSHFGDDIDVIFGPAYKGIPLALGAAQQYTAQTGKNVGWAYDRKEAKTHGDKGSFVGAPLANKARVVIVDDVITAGTAIRESLAKLQPLDVEIAGVIVSVNREEIGPKGTATAIEEIRAETGLAVEAIVQVSTVADHLFNNDIAGRRYLNNEDYQRITDHLAKQKPSA